MGIKWQYLQPSFAIISGGEWYRHQMLSLIGIILFFGRNNRAHSNRCIANTWTLAQLFERVMDSLWRTDYYRWIVEFALHTVAVQGTAHRPTLDDDQY